MFLANRELTYQISNHMSKIAKYGKITYMTLYEIMPKKLQVWTTGLKERHKDCTTGKNHGIKKVANFGI